MGHENLHTEHRNAAVRNVCIWSGPAKDPRWRAGGRQHCGRLSHSGRLELLRIAEDEQTRVQLLAKVLKNYRFSGIQVEVLVSAIQSTQKRQELIEISLLNHPEMTDRERLVARMRRAQPTGQVPDRATAREASVAL